MTPALYQAAIDLSGGDAYFALQRGNEELLLSRRKAMRGREAAGLPVWMQSLLEEAGVAIQDVQAWTVGSGPGSFTGMRLAAALVTGLCYGRLDTAARCVPSAVALAANCADLHDGESVACLYDGRNREFLVYEVRYQAGYFEPTGLARVCTAEEGEALFATYRPERIVAPGSDSAALSRLLPAAALACLEVYDELKPEALLKCSRQEFDGILDELVYIRPAVFTTPLA